MDPRVARTRASLQESLLELARLHPLDDITIADITGHAAVNRSSFYQHYGDKETLLADALEGAIDVVSSQLQSPVASDLSAAPRELYLYLEHIADNIEVYRRVLGTQGSTVVIERLRHHIERLVPEHVGDDAPPHLRGVPADVIGAGIAGTALGVIGAWVVRDPLPPVDIAADWMWRMIVGQSL